MRVTTIMVTTTAITITTAERSRKRKDTDMWRSTLHFSRAKPIVFVAVIAVLAWHARAQEPAPDGPGAGGPVNAMCPVMPDEPVDPAFTVEHDGVTIGLCCRRCVTKFNANPAAFISNLPELVPVSMETDPIETAVAEHDHAPLDMTQEPQHQDSNTHAHEHDESQTTVVSWLGRFHPPTSHLPIGLLIGALVAECMLMLTGRESFKHAAAFCLAVGAIGAVAAAILGWFNGGIAFTDGDWVQSTHRWFGTTTAALALVTVALLARSRRSQTRKPYRAALLTTVTSIGATGFFGGALVYGLNHYALP
ncbi:MAG: hypothetical protein DHS20C14_16800 [Phycisphaeraceae bacterium]|nr:MAG: hypothetical protein DHS20C14_16800 [Phycisphaeraceae bacterium]